ncbi:MAG: 16S rRNA (cytosine(1402)-N(4))-methyltransferase [Vicinamibacterales bacterium]|nr:16S rRNA (cytosine(1402)-N(4))-methyltransferase [Vicinamibacterales bacterium]
MWPSWVGPASPVCLLRNLPASLAPGGRAVFLSFHSGEDRRVKKPFQAGLRAGNYAAASEEPIRPAPEERRANPRATAAKLRCVVRAA